MTDSAKLPKIVILGTGGTIVSSGDDPLMLTGYRIKGLNVETLLGRSLHTYLADR